MTDKERKAIKEQLNDQLKGYSTVSKLARAAGATVIVGSAVTAPLIDLPLPFVAESVEAAVVTGSVGITITRGLFNTLFSPE
jgi:hypothetical protein